MFTFAYPDSLLTFPSIEEAYSKALSLSHNVMRDVIVYELAEVRRVISVIPPPAAPLRVG
jgi:hypothetical protein